MGHQNTQFCFRRFVWTSWNSTVLKTKEEKTCYCEFSICVTETFKHVNTCFKTGNYEIFSRQCDFFLVIICLNFMF